MDTSLQLSVVIPAYKEEERLPRAIPAIIAYLQSRNLKFEIIVVDDGSPDNTAQVAGELAKQYPMLRVISYKPNRGKGGAVKTGMLAAAGQFVLFTDADQSTPINEVDKLLEKLRAGACDIAIGSRRVAGARVEEAQKRPRALASRLFAVAARTLCVRGIADTQCGFKCMTREAAQKIFQQVTTDTAIFDIEMFVIAAREGYRVAELPVRWVHDHDTRIHYTARKAFEVWAELWRIRQVQRVGLPWKVRT